MARVDCTGAEKGTVNEFNSTTVGSGGTFESSTAQARAGSRSWRADRSGAAVASQVMGTMTLEASTATLGLRFSFRVAEVSTAHTAIVTAKAGVAEVAEFAVQKINAADTTFRAILNLQNAGGSTSVAIVAGLAFNTWYDAGFRITANTGAGQTEQLFGRVGTTTANTAAADRITANFNAVDVGLTNSDINDAEVFVDDVIIDNTNTELGEPFLRYFEPTALKAPNTWTQTGGASKVDAITDENDATGVTSQNAVGDTGSREEQYDFADLNDLPDAHHIRVMYLSVREQRGTTAGDFQVYTQQGAAKVTKTLTASLVATTRRSTLVTTTDGAGNAWNESRYNSSGVGLFWLSGQAATAGVRVNEFWGYAEVTAAAQITDTATNTLVDPPATGAAQDFDGTNDYATRGGNLTGLNANGRSFVFSCFIHPDVDPPTQRLFQGVTAINGSLPRVGINLTGSATLLNATVFGINESGTTLFTKSRQGLKLSVWNHFLIAVDLDQVDAEKRVMIAINDQYSTIGGGAPIQDDIDFTLGDWSVGALANGGNKYDGCVSELWFHTGVWADLSGAANRQKFVTPLITPADLGTDGSTPFGVQPFVYMPAGNPADNKGSGGNFTVNGALTPCATTPHSPRKALYILGKIPLARALTILRSIFAKVRFKVDDIFSFISSISSLSIKFVISLTPSFIENIFIKAQIPINKVISFIETTLSKIQFSINSSQALTRLTPKILTKFSHVISFSLIRNFFLKIRFLLNRNFTNNNSLRFLAKTLLTDQQIFNTSFSVLNKVVLEEFATVSHNITEVAKYFRDRGEPGSVKFIPISNKPKNKKKKLLEELLDQEVSDAEFETIFNSLINKIETKDHLTEFDLSDDEEALLYIILAINNGEL